MSTFAPRTDEYRRDGSSGRWNVTISSRYTPVTPLYCVSAPASIPSEKQARYLCACNHNIKEHNERIPEGLTAFPLERLLYGHQGSRGFRKHPPAGVLRQRSG